MENLKKEDIEKAFWFIPVSMFNQWNIVFTIRFFSETDPGKKRELAQSFKNISFGFQKLITAAKVMQSGRQIEKVLLVDTDGAVIDCSNIDPNKVTQSEHIDLSENDMANLIIEFSKQLK